MIKVKGIVFCLFGLLAVAIGSLAGCRSARPVANVQTTVRDSTVVSYVPVEVPVRGQSVAASVNLDSLLRRPKADRPVDMDRTVTSGDGKTSLKYRVDETGRLRIRCETQDHVLNVLAAEITKLRSEERVETAVVEVPKTPAWNYMLMCLLGAAIVLSLFKR